VEVKKLVENTNLRLICNKLHERFREWKKQDAAGKTTKKSKRSAVNNEENKRTNDYGPAIFVANKWTVSCH